MNINNILFGIGHERKTSWKEFSIWLGMRMIKIHLYPKKIKRPKVYYYSSTSMEFIYKNWELSFNWFIGYVGKSNNIK